MRSNVLNAIEDYGLSAEDYEGLLTECAKKTHHESMLSWEEIASSYGLDWTGDCLRKASQVPLVGGTFVKEYFEHKILDQCNLRSTDLTLLNDKIRELEKEKIKYRDQRNEWAKQNRTHARQEEVLDLLEDKIKEISEDRYRTGIAPFTPIQSIGDEEKELVITLSDLHTGMKFDSFIGKYDSETLRQRMGQYNEKIIRIATKNQIKAIHLVALGDLISGNIHKTIAISNKENIIEQVKIVSVLISDFIFRLCENGFEVHFYNVAGNHSRLAKKEEAVHDERLDDLVGWIVANMLSLNDRFIMHENKDTGISVLDVLNHSFVAVHGDFDAGSEASIYRLSTSLKFIPYGIICGHRHHPEYREMNGVKLIQTGSMCGAGDSYTLEKRLTGSPSQTAFIVNADGIECLFNIEF